MPERIIFSGGRWIKAPDETKPASAAPEKREPLAAVLLAPQEETRLSGHLAADLMAKATIADAAEQKAPPTSARKQQATAEGDAEMVRAIGGMTKGGKSRLGTLPESDIILETYRPRMTVQTGSSLFSKTVKGHVEEDPETHEQKWVPQTEAEVGQHVRTFNKTMLGHA